MLLTATGIAIASASQLAAAQDTASAVKLDSQTIVGETAPSRTTHSFSAKNTAPLLDMPQTIQVIPAELIKEQQALSLRQVLPITRGQRVCSFFLAAKYDSRGCTAQFAV